MRLQKVKLPKHLAESPYLQPFYGSISSYVRSTFSGYIGWFSGNISDLHPLTVEERAKKLESWLKGKLKYLMRHKMLSIMENISGPWN